MYPMYLAYFICICTAAAGVLGQGNKCQIFTNNNPCPPGNELVTARCGHGLMECVPCREGYSQCDFTNTSFPVKCYRIPCPEMDEGVTKVRLTWNEDKTCTVSCVCNEAMGYTGTLGFNCSLHEQPCGVDRELRNGSCVPCDKGHHNADPKFGRCDPDVSKSPSTQPSSSTWRPLMDLVTEVLHSTQNIPTSQDDESTNYTTVAVVVIAVVAVVAIIVVIACVKSGKINIACCGRAIQDSNNTDREGCDTQERSGDHPPPPYSDDRLPNGTNHCRLNADNGSCPNGTTGGQSNRTTRHQQPNGGYQTPTGDQANELADGPSTDGLTDGSISSNGGGELSTGMTWNHSLDPSGTLGESGDTNRSTSSFGTSRQSPTYSQAEYSIRAIPEASQAPQHGQNNPMQNVDTADESIPLNILGSSLSALTTKSADVFDPDQIERKMLLSSTSEVAAVSLEANETHQLLPDNHSSQAFGELDINRY
ncbi:uncharacterized protein [Haliotis asinina]|uniref:uncharacterized protein isoform X2 n=1 Tax=Haliotis asinina TaxID=109174 RepID=UPI00353252BC